jgi:hypothetical protein
MQQVVPDKTDTATDGSEYSARQRGWIANRERYYSYLSTVHLCQRQNSRAAAACGENAEAAGFRKKVPNLNAPGIASVVFLGAHVALLSPLIFFYSIF